MIKKIKTLMGILGTDKDDLIETLIEICEDEVREYCQIEDVSCLKNTIIQMVIHKYNRLGTEGIASENYSGASYSYSDYPTVVLETLDRYRKLPCLKVI